LAFCRITAITPADSELRMPAKPRALSAAAAAVPSDDAIVDPRASSCGAIEPRSRGFFYESASLAQMRRLTRQAASARGDWNIQARL
jgi:hypothetical protein